MIEKERNKQMEVFVVNPSSRKNQDMNQKTNTPIAN